MTTKHESDFEPELCNNRYNKKKFTENFDMSEYFGLII